MFYAGDDSAAKRMAHELATGLGFDAVDAGPLSRAREPEHLALLWISLSVSGHGRVSRSGSCAAEDIRGAHVPLTSGGSLS